jgi:hypothetical protein
VTPDNPTPLRLAPAPTTAVELEGLARNRICTLLDRVDELQPSTVVFDLWAALDQLIDPMSPPALSPGGTAGDHATELRQTVEDLENAAGLAATPADTARYRIAGTLVGRALLAIESQP